MHSTKLSHKPANTLRNQKRKAGSSSADIPYINSTTALDAQVTQWSEPMKTVVVHSRHAYNFRVVAKQRFRALAQDFRHISQPPVSELAAALKTVVLGSA